MNINEYNSDPRYWAVWEKMQLLQIEDISTPRQEKNGTIVWRLPIKNNYYKSKPNYIEVASFSTGYVRNQNSGYSNYQLNKRCEGEPEYFDSGRKDSMDRPMYTKFTTRSCVLIPIEIDRLEYLLKYCLKNYYIKHANQVADGDFYPKWMYENAIEDRDNQGWRTKVKDLEGRLNLAQEDLSDVLEKRDYYKDKCKKLDDFYEAQKAFDDSMYEGRDDRVKELEQEVQDLKDIIDEKSLLADISITVNGEKYKII